VKFFISEDIDSDDSIKMADLTLKKLGIAVEQKIIKYKILDMEKFNINVSIWSSREMN
jgi:hypothetical protein